jgi:acetyl-CoA C-acetyltransferase
MNPSAQFPFKTTMEGVAGAVMVADPLTLMDCSPITDGGAAVILGTREVAEKAGIPLVRIAGIGAATDSLALAQRPDMSWIASAEVAGERAFEMAGKSKDDIHLIEVHDCFTISELMVLESLGFFERGKAGPATLAGETAIDGSLPVNTSGGLKSKGHPVGATGVAQVIEVARQLRGDAGGRQVKGAKVGMTQNMGGTGATSVCTILEVK